MAFEMGPKPTPSPTPSVNIGSLPSLQQPATLQHLQTWGSILDLSLLHMGNEWGTHGGGVAQTRKIITYRVVPGAPTKIGCNLVEACMQCSFRAIMLM